MMVTGAVPVISTVPILVVPVGIAPSRVAGL